MIDATLGAHTVLIQSQMACTQDRQRLEANSVKHEGHFAKLDRLRAFLTANLKVSLVLHEVEVLLVQTHDVGIARAVVHIFQEDGNSSRVALDFALDLNKSALPSPSSLMGRRWCLRPPKTGGIQHGLPSRWARCAPSP